MGENIQVDSNFRVRFRRESQPLGARKSLSSFEVSKLVLLYSFDNLVDWFISSSTLTGEFDERGTLRMSDGIVYVINSIWVDIPTPIVTNSRGTGCTSEV